MSSESKTDRGAWIGRLGWIGKGTIALLSILLGSGLLYFVYENFVNVPDVVYAVLPTYGIEGQSFGGVVVDNRGKATAHDVRISLGRLGTTIEQTSVQSEESWRQEGGGSGEATLVIWLDRMARGSSVTVYMLTEEVPQLDDGAITTEEGPGHVAGGPSIAALAPPVALGSVVGGLVASAVWCWLYLRLRSRAAFLEKYTEGLKQTVSTLQSLTQSYKEELQQWQSGERFPPAPTVIR
ncbi:MAG TPA: hypothetical protein VMW58_06470 [Anaerolineae bacterium]|nr:hypothetical protein [Anaerolineae bacterium]